MNELQVIVTQQAGVIDFNFEESKKLLAEKVNEYKGIIINEDTVDKGKKDLAKLRSNKKAFDDRRIEVKKLFMKPYDDFEGKAKQLIALFDEPIKEINDQLIHFEEKRKTEKKASITCVYNELIGDMAEYLPLNKIYDPKWDNATTTMKSIRESIVQLVDGTSLSVQTIKGMNSECLPDVLNQFKKDLSLSNAITTINRYEQQRREILEREEAKRKADEERKAREEARKEDQRIREEELKRAEQEEHMRREQERIAEETKPVDFCEEPFIIKEPAFQADEQPFIVPKKVLGYEVIIDEDMEDSLVAFLESLGCTFRRI